MKLNTLLPINYIQKHRLLFLVLSILLVGRLAISGEGYLEDSDEVDYYCAENAFDALIDFRFADFSNHLALTEGKPTETFLKVMQVPFHRAFAFIINEPRHSPAALWILGLVNITVSLCLLFAFYVLLRQVQIAYIPSVVGTLWLGVFINFNLYTRHLLSYDLGLLFFVTALLCLLYTNANEIKRIQLAGLLTALGITTYHGYFMMGFIIGIWLLFGNNFKRISVTQRIKHFTIGFLPLLILYEIIFYPGGHSFIGENLKISETINQGSHQEGFLFAWLYLTKIEGIAGIACLALFALAAIYFFTRKPPSPVSILIISGLVAYLIYATAVYYFHILVFYGRIWHMYYPFMVMGAVFILSKFKWIESRWTAAFLLCILCFQYGINIQSLNSITYPRKVLDKFGVLLPDGSVAEKHYKYTMRSVERYVSNEYFRKYAAKPLENNNYIFTNTCFFSHFPDFFLTTYEPLNVPGRKVYSKLHFMSYPAYTFEYCSTYGRSFFENKKIHIEVIDPNE